MSLLSSSDVHAIIKIVEELDPIIVGGQSIILWAEYFAQAEPRLADLSTLSSKDIDFFDNEEAAKKLADSMIGGVLTVAQAYDHTPNAAVVVGNLNGRSISIDFMADVLGVDRDAILTRYISIVGAMPGWPEPLSLALLHPLDCIKSRLANVSTLRRTETHSVEQTIASFLVFESFVDEILDSDDRERVPALLQEYARDVATYFFEGSAYGVCKDFIDPISTLKRFEADDRLHDKWREHNLKSLIQRLERKHEIAQRRFDFNQKRAEAEAPPEPD